MRIGCVQFAPQTGDVDNNLNRADAVLNRADPGDLDLLVLPELAFTGSKFQSLRDISPFLEPSCSGISSLWARTVALKYECTVVVGYPEKVDPALKWPTSPEYYNSAIVVNADGETVANCRKTHIQLTDETWALENPRGFYDGVLTGLGNTAIGIGMDLNSSRFAGSLDSFEFADHILRTHANLVIITMAHSTSQDGRAFTRMPQQPDMDSLLQWVTRLRPIIQAENSDEVIVVFANRCGSEGRTFFSGTSTVIGVLEGEVRLYGSLGRGEKELLIIDTNLPPQASLVYRPDQAASNSKGGGKLHLEQFHQNAVAFDQGPRSLAARFDSNSQAPMARQSTCSGEQSNKTESSRGRSSRSKAAGLSLKTDAQTLGLHDSTADPLIRTPTCPSPTPISLRPRLTIPPAESLTMRYLSENSAPSSSVLAERPETRKKVPHNLTPHPVFSTSQQPIMILGGEVTVIESGHSPDTSPSRFSTSYFSPDTTPFTPKFYWDPSDQLQQDLIESRRWTPYILSKASATEAANSSPLMSHSNNLPSELPRPDSHAISSEAAADSKELQGGNPNEEQDRSGKFGISSTGPGHGKDSVSRPASPKSRNASRSRGPGYTGSAHPGSVPSGIQSLLNDQVQRVGSAQAMRGPGVQLNPRSQSVGRMPSELRESLTVSTLDQSNFGLASTSDPTDHDESNDKVSNDSNKTASMIVGRRKATPNAVERDRYIAQSSPSAQLSNVCHAETRSAPKRYTHRGRYADSHNYAQNVEAFRGKIARKSNSLQITPTVEPPTVSGDRNSKGISSAGHPTLNLAHLIEPLETGSLSIRTEASSTLKHVYRRQSTIYPDSSGDPLEPKTPQPMSLEPEVDCLLPRHKNVNSSISEIDSVAERPRSVLW